MAKDDTLLISFEKLRWERRNAPHTLVSLSSATGISYSYISELETGSVDNPGIRVLETLARELGVSVLDLYEAKWIPREEGRR